MVSKQQQTKSCVPAENFGDDDGARIRTLETWSNRDQQEMKHMGSVQDAF